MATTVERLTKFQGEWFTTAAISLILANAKILKGVLGMQVAGKAQKAGIGQAGAKLLGIAEKTYDNSAVGTDTTLASPMIFRRGACFLDNSGVSPVTGADTDTLTRPVEQEDDGGHDRFAHYIKKEKIVESAVTGKSVRALCGKKWVPSRDPQKYPVCPICKEICEAENNNCFI